MPELKREEVQDSAVEATRLLNPAAKLTWFDAIEFCNRLSDQENLPHDYELGKLKKEDGHITAAEASVLELSGPGYRLPKQTECEYACRAMSVNGYCYGDAELFLPEYAVFRAGCTDVCGQHIPNSSGLYDMHGNVWEWCWDEYDPAEKYIFRYHVFLRACSHLWPSFDRRNYRSTPRVAQDALFNHAVGTGGDRSPNTWHRFWPPTREV